MGDAKSNEEMEATLFCEVQIKQEDKNDEINELGLLDPVVPEDILTELDQITMKKAKAKSQREQNLETIKAYLTAKCREVLVKKTKPTKGNRLKDMSTISKKNRQPSQQPQYIEPAVQQQTGIDTQKCGKYGYIFRKNPDYSRYFNTVRFTYDNQPSQPEDLSDPVVPEEILMELEQIRDKNKAAKSQTECDQNLEKIRGFRTYESPVVTEKSLMQQLLEAPSAPQKLDEQPSATRDGRPHKCNHCKKGFIDISELNHHMRNHTQEKNSMCEECGKLFKWPKYLKNHIRIVHRGEKKYQCDQCGKAYAYSNNFAHHMRVHNGERPFGCSYCDMRFVRSCSLKNHLRIHTGETPYECKNCGKKFRKSTHLDQHVRLHTGQMYVCHICNKTFRQKPGITQHLKIHKKFTLVKD